MLIGAHGRFWDRELVDFQASGWRLLGRRGSNRGTVQIVDFQRAQGVYVLYNEVGVYYVGLAQGAQGLGRRLKDHATSDRHSNQWTRFSWFSFSDVSDRRDSDGVYDTFNSDGFDVDTQVAIRDLEAILQIALQPVGNCNETRFQQGDEWIQVATQTPQVRVFDEWRDRLL